MKKQYESLRDRSHYRNGDMISLMGGCDGCSPSVINGILCHERGCPDAWRDALFACMDCGSDFYRDTLGRVLCGDCIRNEEQCRHICIVCHESFSPSGDSDTCFDCQWEDWEDRYDEES